MSEFQWHIIDCFPIKGSPFLKSTFKNKDYIIMPVNDNADSKWTAVKDSCPHAGGKFSRGWCDENGLLTCPLHQFKFDLKTGREVTGNGFSLSKYPIKEIEDEFFIGIKSSKWWPF